MTTEPRTLAVLLEEARTLLEAKTTIYAPLLALVREGCVDYCERIDAHARHCYRDKPPQPTCFYCQGTGYITRIHYWGQASDGALEGALIKVLRRTWREAAPGVAYRCQDWTLAHTLEQLMWSNEGDTRRAALAAVIEWLKSDGIE